MPRRTEWAKINRVSSNIKRRATVTAVQTHVITVTQYFLLSLWSFVHISYAVVIIRLQIAESYGTLSRVCNKQATSTNDSVLLNALAGNKEYV